VVEIGYIGRRVDRDLESDQCSFTLLDSGGPCEPQDCGRAQQEHGEGMS
jgi:hypothetical protein